MISGGILLAFPQLIFDLIGIGSPLLFQLLGFALIAFAALVALLARQPSPDPFRALLISVADLLWVLSTAVVILFTYGMLTTTGIFIMVGVALFVLIFSLAQLRGIAQTFQVEGSSTSTYRLCIDVETDESAQAMWNVIADLGGVDRFSPSLASVQLRDDAKAGVGAIRDCQGTNGASWSERCIIFEPEDRRYTVEFLTDDPNFPYPFRTMTGGWRVRSEKRGSVVTIWFETTPKSVWTTPFLLPIMGRSITSNLSRVVTNMAADVRGDSLSAKTPRDQKLPATLVAC